MSIVIKTAEEIEKMRAAGKLAAQVLEMIAPHVKPGVTTNELNDLCAKYTEEQGAISAPLNYHGFPKSICTSVNHVICHGIPNDNPPLKEGDILNIDITVIKDGYHGDTSMMFLIGEVSAKDKRLCRIAQESLYLAIRKVRPGLK
ncbi:type I methionyl aminopeptidase, partial [Pseudomonas saponiphila]